MPFLVGNKRTAWYSYECITDSYIDAQNGIWYYDERKCKGRLVFILIHEQSLYCRPERYVVLCMPEV